MTFIVYGDPQGKARPRFTNKGRTYTPKNTVEYEKRIRDAFIAAGGKLIDGYVSVVVQSVFEVPKSYTKKKKLQAAEGTLLPSKKPDIDNILKCVLDGLNGVAYKDDSYVVKAEEVKVYGEQAMVIVCIEQTEKIVIPDRVRMGHLLGM